MKHLQMKVFSKRESLITELLEVKHFKILKHIFLAVLFGFISRDVVKSFSNNKVVDFGLTTITGAFANFHVALSCWILLFGINLLAYALFTYWALKRIEFVPKSIYVKIWDSLFLIIIVMYDSIAILAFPLIQFYYLNLGIASSFAIQLENVRLIMKFHAFIRNSTPDVLTYKPHTDSKLNLPTLSNYLYFFFAPTLLYRKEYPRTEKVNWKRILVHFCEVLCIIWLESYIYEAYFIKPFSSIGRSHVSWYTIAVTVTENSIAGGLMMLINFYLLLHAWCNGFAELLNFGDRQFYEDWWTSTNYSIYFRSWNIVVQDWLYEYVYSDFYHYIIPKNRTIAKCMVFLLSALVHEQIIIFSLGHFFPVLFVFFCCGAMFTTLRTTHPLYNIFLLYSLALGNGIQLSLHTIEYYARANCPYSERKNSTGFVPRFITLDCL